MKAVPFLFAHLVVATLAAGAVFGGAWAWLTPLVVFVGLPVLDALIGLAPADEGEAPPPTSLAHDLVLLSYAPALVGAVGLAVSAVSAGGLGGAELAGLGLSASLASAAGINVAHELMHRKAAWARAVAEGLMTLVSYTHFCIEHVHGHHRHVATPLDPATARLGEWWIAYLPRVLVGSLASAIRIERARNERRGVRWWSPGNRLLRYPLEIAALHVAVVVAAGPAGWAFFAAQGLGAVLLLETINYVEHYGLQRAESAPGRYELVQPKHSWNANHRVTNWWLFNLQRHADHHANAHRPYWQLRPFADGAQLPFAYPVMILLAPITPLWRAVMDPRVAEARGGDPVTP